MTLKEIRDRLKNKTVGIAGCGGLGSNCAVALARTGIGKLILVDFDKVEESNLNRQYFFSKQVGMPKVKALRDNIHKIDKQVRTDIHMTQLQASSVIELFSECDLIIEAFDSDHAKKMIIETVMSELPGKPLISGQGLAGYGNNEAIITRKLEDLYIIGDAMTDVSEDQPPLAPRVAIVANMQANLALDLLLKDE
jgi:sulfur carrier protein ThiS adenylyltransferase